MSIIVSSHGGRFTNTPEIVVPQGRTIHFYVHDNTPLPNNLSWTVLAELKEGKIDESKIVTSIAGGGKVYNYSCWYYPAIVAKNGCGIFQVGCGASEKPKDDLSQYTEKKPLELATIFENSEGDIFWLACTSAA